jgi:hypothetical protein
VKTDDKRRLKLAIMRSVGEHLAATVSELAPPGVKLVTRNDDTGKAVAIIAKSDAATTAYLLVTIKEVM